MNYLEAFMESAQLMEVNTDKESVESLQQLFDYLNETANEDLNEAQLFIKIMIKAADLYARSKWDEACELTRLSLTSESPLKPEFKP